MNTQQFDPNQFQGELVVNSNGIADGMLVMTLGLTAIFAIGALICLITMLRSKKKQLRLRMVAGFWICLIMASLFFIMPKVASFPRESLWAYVKLGQTLVYLAAFILAFRASFWLIKFVWWVFSFGAIRGAKFPGFPWDDKFKFALAFATLFVLVGWTYPWLLSLAMQ